VFALGTLAAGGLGGWAQQSAAPTARPRITGISHVGYFVSDLPKALEFWHGLLGFDVSYELKDPKTGAVQIAFLKINDHQHVELLNLPPTAPPSMLSHVCFSVDSVEQMRAYLKSQDVAIRPRSAKTRMGDHALEVTDPDGAEVEFVESLPDGVEAKLAGQFLSPDRVSTKIYHAGFIVGNSQRSLDFYGKMLGFQETWRGGADPKELSWINMRAPDGDDYVEFMLYRTYDPKRLGTMNHLSLAVPDIDKAVAALKTRPAFAGYGRPLEVHLGVNRKRQVNLFDPDGTRVELMEPFTIDGKVTPSSTAPPPAPSHDE
jgi:lactoylglutathione lyase